MPLGFGCGAAEAEGRDGARDAGAELDAGERSPGTTARSGAGGGGDPSGRGPAADVAVAEGAFGDPAALGTADTRLAGPSFSV